MSECQISIEFGRPNRTYLGGETVSGIVRISAEEEVNCKGIKLTYRWKTHGKGNANYGPVDTVVLDGPSLLVAGVKLEFPFSITAATHPVTYHGHLVSIDHYVRVDVDVPWSRNPSAEEDFVVSPGAVPPQMTGNRSERVSLKADTATESNWIVKSILLPVAVLLLLAVAVFALFLLPIILIVAAGFWVRSQMVASRLGTVEVSMPHLIVAPGEEWPITIRFTPRKSFSINAITLQMEAEETAISGSGTKATTHTHKLHSQSHVIREGGPLEAGETVDEKFSIKIPPSNEYSFDESSNKVQWKARVRIDIPRFPDWIKTETLQLVPVEFLGGKENLKRVEYDSEVAGGALSSAPVFANQMAMKNEFESPADLDESAFVPGTIGELVAQLDAAGRHSSQSASIIANVAQIPFEVSVLIDRVASSFGVMSMDERYANGKTVTGTIERTRQAIQVLTTEASSKELDDYRRGTVWRTEVTVIGWDTLYNRISAQQIE